MTRQHKQSSPQHSVSHGDNTWKKIITFGVLMVIVNAIFNVLIIMNGGDIQQNIPYAIGLIFSPAVVSIVVNLIYERNLRGFGWKWRDNKMMLLSYVVPLIYVALVYGSTLLLGWAGLNSEKTNELGWIGIAMIPTLGISGVVLEVIGEEVGWRGFLLTNLLKKMSFTKASMMVGITWAVFHFPLIIFGNFSGNKTPLLFALICFTVAILGANMAINWLFVKSGSLWAAVIFHATHNSLLNDIHPLLVNKEITPYVVTEFGALLALVLAIVGAMFWRQRSRLPLVPPTK